METKARGRFFCVYGRDMATRWHIGNEYVIEEVEWMPGENNRGGTAFVIHLHKLVLGVGRFDRQLTEAEMEQFEEEAVWLDVKPTAIGRWKGHRETTAAQLGYGYQPHRPPDAEAAGEDEHDGADPLG